jgi:hypothetical protein
MTDWVELHLTPEDATEFHGLHNDGVADLELDWVRASDGVWFARIIANAKDRPVSQRRRESLTCEEAAEFLGITEDEAYYLPLPSGIRSRWRYAVPPRSRRILRSHQP